jgi:serine/threonine protein kinase
VLVNLTCGRNPWKQASQEDSAYRAFTRSPGFLKTILPLSDELNDILSRIFTPNPEQRITLPELKARILSCSRFTEPPTMALPTPPTSPDALISEYVTCEDAVVDLDDLEPLSPASSDDDCLSDGGSCSSDEGSLASSASSLDDFDDLRRDIPVATTPPPQPEGPLAIYEPEEPRIVDFSPEYAQFHAMAEPVIQQPVPIAVQQQPVSKYYLPNVVLDWVGNLKYAQFAPQAQHHMAFHHQVPLFPAIPGCS